MIHSIQTLAMLMTVFCCLLVNVSSVPTCNFLGCFGSKADRILPDSFFDGLTNCGPLQNIRPFLKTNDFVKGYKIEKAIGCGSLGLVVSATDLKKKRLVAIKLTPYEGAKKDWVDNEIAALIFAAEKFNSRYFTQYYESKIVSGLMAIVMELVSGVDMDVFFQENRDNGLTEFTVHRIFQDVFKGTLLIVIQLLGLNELKKAGRCHNDIKPGNIMVYKGADGLPASKIVDLTLLLRVGTHRPPGFIGTKRFNAPEMLSQQAYKDCYATDVYATGVSLFKIAYGNYPFTNIQAIVGGKIASSPLRFHGSQLLVNILNEMMNRDSYKRITIDRILQHPWTLQAFPANSMTAAVTHLKYQK